ncbi:MAG: GxxExxY protein [Flavobacteriales bacterium]
MYQVIGAAIEVHKELGPGLLESVYHRCMKHELSIRNISFVSEVLVQTDYKGIDLQVDLGCDFLVENELVVELKSVEGILAVHDAQVLSYMKLLKKPKGVLINFNCDNVFKSGQKTYVNNLYRILPDK